MMQLTKKCAPILFPAVFNAAKRGKKPTKSELEQLISLGDHKLDRQSPLLPVLPGLPVHISQNIASKLGLAIGSTGTGLKNRFPSVPEGFPDSTVPILPLYLTKQITCLPNRKFSLKMKQIPLSSCYSCNNV